MDRRKYGFTRGDEGTCGPGWTPVVRSCSLPSRNRQHLLRFSCHTVPGLTTLSQTSPAAAVELKNPRRALVWQKQHDKGLFSGCERTSHSMASTSPPPGRGSSDSNLVSSFPPSNDRGVLFLSHCRPLLFIVALLCLSLLSSSKITISLLSHQEAVMPPCQDMMEDTPPTPHPLHSFQFH